MPILTNHQTNTLGKNDDTDLLTFTSGELDVAGACLLYTSPSPRD